MKKLTLTLATAVLATCIAGPLAAQTFTSHPISIPGSSNVFTYGINDSGVMIVNYTDASGTSHCLSIVGKTVTKIVDPNQVIPANGGGGTSCYGINNAGQIVGSYSTNPFSNGFLYSGGTYTDLIVPTATAGTVASGINNVGEMVGFFADNSGSHAFLYTVSSGIYQTLDAPAATATLAVAINDRGTITLQWYDVSSNIHGAVYNNGTYTTVDVPGVAHTYIHGINNFNRIIFSCTDASGEYHGFMYKSGAFVQFDVANAANTHGWGINNAGQIVGGFNPSSNPSASVGFGGHF